MASVPNPNCGGTVSRSDLGCAGNDAMLRKGLLFLLTALMVACQARLYRESADSALQLPYLHTQLNNGMGRDMQQLFPEGNFFSYMLYGLTWVNVGLEDAARRDEALREARWAYEQLAPPEGAIPFSANLDPEYGIFYRGWRNWLLGGIVLLGGDMVEEFSAECNTLASALTHAPHPFLPSYPNQIWPVDTFPAAASIRVCARTTSDKFGTFFDGWLARIEPYRDPATGLFPHKIDAATGAIVDGTRATSQTLILRFFAEIDPDQAARDYTLFRTQFVTTRAGIPAVREFPHGVAGVGDVDSGPLLWDISLSATAVMLGTARVFGDEELAGALAGSAETFGLPFTFKANKRYAFGALPIGDAFVALAHSEQNWWIAPPTIANTGFGWWQLPLHLLSLLCVMPFWWRFYRRPPSTTS